ncbi:hypothetical protein HMPREF0653_00817, partial [Prevotella disiens JCM 6334 = ATCC 29426]
GVVGSNPTRGSKKTKEYQLLMLLFLFFESVVFSHKSLEKYFVLFSKKRKE